MSFLHYHLFMHMVVVFHVLCRYKEYRLQDYSPWFIKQACPNSFFEKFRCLSIFFLVCNKFTFLCAGITFFSFKMKLNDTEKWTRLRSCLVKSDDCSSLSKRYKVPPILHSSHFLSPDVLSWSFFICNHSFCGDLCTLFDFMQTLKQYRFADLTPIESGCCRPPAEYAPEPFSVFWTYNLVIIIL